MLTLLWGLASESPLAAVRAELDKLGAPVLLLDQRELAGVDVRLSVGAHTGGWIRVGARGAHHALDAISAVYVRPYGFWDVPAIAAAGPASPAWRHAAAIDEALWSWLEVTPAVVVSRASAMASNGSKPYQLQQIRTCGFRVPETLVTTDPEAARAFWRRHGSVIYKSVSGIRSVVSRLETADGARLDDVRHCPTQFQRYVAGTDHRVHVVGGEIFAAAVASEATDYRYPGQHDVDISPCRLPADVEERCRRLARCLGLPVAGVDLRKGADGDWYCFEVNPAPAFTYYEAATGLPIGAAIARLLVGRPEQPRPPHRGGRQRVAAAPNLGRRPHLGPPGRWSHALL